MKKITVVFLLILLMAGAAFAANRADVQAKAQEIAGEDARLTETDREGIFYEFEFSAKGSKITVLMNGDSLTAILKETEFPGTGRAKTVKLTEADAAQAALLSVPNGSVVYAAAEKDDGAAEWKVFVKTEAALVQIELNAETGAVSGIKEAYSANLISPEQAITALSLASANGEIEIREISVDFDDDRARFVYDGEAVSGGKVFEFEVNAETGSVVEWERD